MKPKKIKVELIPRDAKAKPKGDPYAVLDGLVKAHHPDVRQARIALAWQRGWKADPDGHLKLGKAKKATDLDRELQEYDFVILLNRDVWNRVDFSEKQISALLDHQVCHCGRAFDSEGSPQEDDRGRPVWRMVKHDLEEFQAVIERHGRWKRDIDQFVKAALKHPSLFPDAEAGPPLRMPEPITVNVQTGEVTSVPRGQKKRVEVRALFNGKTVGRLRGAIKRELARQRKAAP